MNSVAIPCAQAHQPNEALDGVANRQMVAGACRPSSVVDSVENTAEEGVQRADLTGREHGRQSQEHTELQHDQHASFQVVLGI
jgi:hypothetical protein